MNKEKDSDESKIPVICKDNKLPVIDIPADGNSRWYGGAFTLCFVYSKHKGNFLVKGYNHEVDEYLTKNHTHYFVNKTYWCNGRFRGHWTFWKKDVGIFEPDKDKRFSGRNRQTKYQIREYSWFSSDEEEDRQQKETIHLKRLPHRWIPEFDRF